MSDLKDCPPSGYVKIEQDGNLIRTGSKIERVAGNGERILEGFDFAQTCPWVSQLRGDRRYSGAGGNPVKTEQKVLDGSIALDDGLFLDGEAVRDAKGKYLINSQQGWEQYFAGTGKRLPTVCEYITIIKQLDERKDPAALQGLLQDLRKRTLCTGTKIDYGKSNLPQGDGYLDNLIKDSAWRTALQDFLQHDVEETTNMLQKVSGKRPYIWTPDAAGRISTPERAVWFDIYAGRFLLSCSYCPIGISGRARGVRRESA